MIIRQWHEAVVVQRMPSGACNAFMLVDDAGLLDVTTDYRPRSKVDENVQELARILAF